MTLYSSWPRTRRRGSKYAT